MRADDAALDTDFLQSIDKVEVRRKHCCSCLLDWNKSRSIDFGKYLLVTRSRWPLNGKGITSYRSRIAIALERPCLNNLTSLMLHATERNEVTVRYKAGLLLELSLRGGEFIFSR